MMNTRRAIRDILEGRCENLVVQDVRIGTIYTGVRLEDGRTGVAFTFGDHARGCSLFQGMRPLTGRPAVQLLQCLESDEPVEASVGLATANAVANVAPVGATRGDVLEAVTLLPTDTVAMIGLFRPLLPALRKKVQSVEIFEESGEPSSIARPAAEAFPVLAESSVAIITSTAIVNNSVDRLLKAAANCRLVILLGSSTPLLPQAFEGTPVTHLSGITIDDPDGILQVVSEGGGTRFFKPFVTKWNIPLSESA